MIITVASLLLLGSSTFEFKGGRVEDFVMALSAHTGKPVIMGVDRTVIPEFTVELVKLENQEEYVRLLVRKIASIVGATSKVDNLITLTPDTLPWYRFPALTKDRNVVSEFPDHKDAILVKNDTVQLSSIPKKYFWPVYLPFIDFKHKVGSHKFLQTSPVVFSNSTISEEVFLNGLSRAIGGTLVDHSGEQFIDVDLTVFRSQYAKLFESASNEKISDLQKAKLRFSSEAIRIAPTSIIRQLVDKENHLFDFEIPVGSRAHVLAMQYTSLFIVATKDSESEFTASYREHAKLVVQYGNFQRPLRASCSSLGNVNLRVMIGTEDGGIDY